MLSSSRRGKGAKGRSQSLWELRRNVQHHTLPMSYISDKTRRRSTSTPPGPPSGATATLSISWLLLRTQASVSVKRTKPSCSNDLDKRHQRRKRSTAGPDWVSSSRENVSANHINEDITDSFSQSVNCMEETSASARRRAMGPPSAFSSKSVDQTEPATRMDGRPSDLARTLRIPQLRTSDHRHLDRAIAVPIRTCKTLKNERMSKAGRK